MNHDYDVIIIGAGTAGCVAAIQCARAGARTLLVEKNAAPGGTMTVGMVDFPGLFHAWGRQVIAGIGWEMVEKCVREAGGTMPDFSDFKQPHWKLQVKINPFLYQCLIEEEFRRAEVKVLYHSMPSQVVELEDGVQVTLCGKSSSTNITTAKLIDASADANACSLAGHEITINPTQQPATPMMRLGGYNPDSLDFELIDREYRQAMETGTMLRTDTGMSGRMSTLLRLRGENAVHIPVHNADTSENKTMAEETGRQAVLRIYRFLRQFKGLEQLKIEWLAGECGIRETTVIKGISRISAADYCHGRVFHDSLCYAFYPIDLHLESDEGLDCRPLAEGIVPTVPLSALIPEKSQHMIVAGRCVSSDQLANSALRVQASCMAMGQAAAASAVTAVKHGLPISKVDIAEVKQLLRQHNAITP